MDYKGELTKRKVTGKTNQMTEINKKREEKYKEQGARTG
jgi:hypothetical protein